jgi:hypothetical protein
VAPANENEKRHTPTLLEKTRQILSNAGAELKRVIADSQYSDEKIRRTVEAVIPYPANQKRNVKGLLRVDKKFRIYGPEDLKRKARASPSNLLYKSDGTFPHNNFQNARGCSHFSSSKFLVEFISVSISRCNGLYISSFSLVVLSLCRQYTHR